MAELVAVEIMECPYLITCRHSNQNVAFASHIPSLTMFLPSETQNLLGLKVLTGGKNHIHKESYLLVKLGLLMLPFLNSCGESLSSEMGRGQRRLLPSVVDV